MKKTISASVGRLPFMFEEDAYETLKSYLQSIERHFHALQGGQEVAEDIERRSAELLLHRVPAGRVVATDDVKYVMSVLGSVEEITGAAPIPKSEGSPAPRRLFRDTDNRVLGGVCGGLGAYFNVDPLWFRMAWLALFLFFGSGLLLYLIFWIIVPPARTAAEKLEMRGEPVDVHNLSRNLARKAEATFPAAEARTLWRRLGDDLRSFLERIFTAMAGVFRIIGVAASVIGLMVAVAVLLAVIQLLFGEIFLIRFGESGVELRSWKEGIHRIFPTPWQGWLTLTALALFLLIPALALAARAVRYLFRLPRGPHWIAYPLVSVWLVTMGFLLWSGLRLAREFSSSGVREDHLVWKPDSALVQVSMKFPEVGEGLVVSDVDVHIFRNTSDSLFKVTVQKNARGASRTYANALAESLDYSVAVEGARLRLPAAFVLPQGTPYRGQHVVLFLFVPEGTRLTMDEEVARHLAHVPNLQGMDNEAMARHTWMMTSQGLSCLDCEEN